MLGLLLCTAIKMMRLRALYEPQSMGQSICLLRNQILKSDNLKFKKWPILIEMTLKPIYNLFQLQ